MSAPSPLDLSLALTSSAAVSHAKTSRSPERALVLPGLDLVYGTNMPASFANYDRESSSWKTYQLYLFGGVEPFSGTWPKQGMMRSGRVYALATSERRTDGSGSSLWPTPTGPAGSNQSASSGAVVRPALPLAVKLWPTATAGDSKASGSKGYSTESGRHAGTTLTDAAVRLWPTPTTSEATGAGIAAQGGPNLRTVATWGTPTSRDWKDGMDPSEEVPTNGLLGRQAPRSLPNVSGSLNPAWVEHLMGFPPGWTDLPGWKAPNVKGAWKRNSPIAGPPVPPKPSTTGKPRARRKASTVVPPGSKP